MIVTPLYAGLLGLWFFVLCMRVVVARGQLGINLGDGGNETMNRRIRGHANFVEYVPLCLLLIAILEFSHFSIYLIHALGLALLIGRILHGRLEEHTSELQSLMRISSAVFFLHNKNI